MGDRSNILFQNGDDAPIGVYCHWAGLSLARSAMKVLKNRAFQARLGDADYAIRIGVQVVLADQGASMTEDTGFGLFVGDSPDRNYNDIIINVNTGRLMVGGTAIDNPTEAKIRQLM